MRRRTLLVLFGASGLGLFVASFGSEVQFSPDSFEHRRVRTFSLPHFGFNRLQVPLAKFPRDSYRVKIVRFWLDEGYLAAAPRPPERWDTVSGQASWRGAYWGRAECLWVRGMLDSDKTADRWIAWSRANPAL